MDSHHRFKKYKNHIKTKNYLRLEQVWVSDSLNLKGSLAALELALKNRMYKNEPIIHHSDRGLQYCSNAYQQLLQRNSVMSCMTEKYDSYENAIAERVNGILKQEFDIDKYDMDLKTKKVMVKNSIKIYNN